MEMFPCLIGVVVAEVYTPVKFINLNTHCVCILLNVMIPEFKQKHSLVRMVEFLEDEPPNGDHVPMLASLLSNPLRALYSWGMRELT